jgi:hypothetical protein
MNTHGEHERMILSLVTKDPPDAKCYRQDIVPTNILQGVETKADVAVIELGRYSVVSTSVNLDLVIAENDLPKHLIEDMEDSMERALASIESPPRKTIEARATRAFDLLAALVPRRLADEEIGDAIEHIKRRCEAGVAAWWVIVKVISTFFWVTYHALRARLSSRKELS